MQFKSFGCRKFFLCNQEIFWMNNSVLLNFRCKGFDVSLTNWLLQSRPYKVDSNHDIQKYNFKYIELKARDLKSLIYLVLESLKAECEVSYTWLKDAVSKELCTWFGSFWNSSIKF